MFATSVLSGDIAQATPQTVQEVQVTESLPVETEPLTTEEKVKEYFKDIPVMSKVAYCESRFRQFDTDGNTLRGVQNPADLGVMQINEKYHSAKALSLGMDLHTLEGNMEYARYLYNKEGTRPWKYSSMCWGEAREVAIN